MLPSILGQRMQIGQLKRREFITLLGGAATGWPKAVGAQQSVSRLPRVGAMQTVRSENSEAFEQGLRDAGYVDGRNVILDERFYGTALNLIDDIAPGSKSRTAASPWHDAPNPLCCRPA
jgi:hypothetical protein